MRQPEREGQVSQHANAASDWLQELPVPAAVLSMHGEPLVWNEAAAALHSWKQDAAPGIGGRGVPWFETLLQRVSEHGHGRIVISRRCHGRRQVLELNARSLTPWRLLVLFRDCSSGAALRRRAAMKQTTENEWLKHKERLHHIEEQLRQSQKMETVGRLTAGVAHDFNNMLTAIQGNIYLLLQDLPRGIPGQEHAQEALRSTERAIELTRQLLALARRQPHRPSPIDLSEIVRISDNLLSRLVRADVSMKWSLGPDLPRTLIDPGLAEQVVMNLVVNASEAIERKGSIFVRTSLCEIGPADAEVDSSPSVPPGRYVELRVSDNGSGMSAEVRQGLFEPFFTTKPTGTGLGLATVHGIVKECGGFILVDSAPGVGSTFRVLLPACSPTGID
jgi:signal transduction histidine kinase